MSTTPIPTVDLIIVVEAHRFAPHEDRVVLIDRLKPPFGWALPGGHINYGERYEDAAVREGREETGLDLRIIEQFHTYSDPRRDPRKHTASTVFIMEPIRGEAKAGDDAGKLQVVPVHVALNIELCFDHVTILEDYLYYRQTKQRPRSL